MATEQVFQWIQSDLHLSKAVSNVETDFSNGYMFGEILVHYGLIPDLTHLSKKTNKEAKVNNFYKVEEALRQLKVKFDAKLIHNIMQEERGAALRLLYQLKLACEKHSRVELDDAPEMMSMTNIQNAVLHKVMKKHDQLTLEQTKTIPPPTVGGKDIRTAKQKRQENRTLAFDVNQKTLFDAALAADKDQSNTLWNLQQEQRQINRQKLNENQTFMKEWEQEGDRKWELNQTKRAEGIAKVKYFEDREVRIWREKLRSEFEAAGAECKDGIGEFEKNLQKLGIEQFIAMDEAIKKQEEKKGIPPGQIQNFSYAATMNKIKETKKNTDFAGKERERRKMKMGVDQINAQAKLDGKKNEQELIAKLLAETESEQAEAFTDIRMAKCKNMLIVQRKVVSETLEDTREKKNAIAEAKQIEDGRAREKQRQKELAVMRREQETINKEGKAVKRHLNVEIASGLVDLIMDLADETFKEVDKDDAHQIQKPVWREFLQIFKDGKQVSLRNFKPQPPVNEGSGNTDLQEGTEAFENSQAQLFEFLTGCGMFQLSTLKPHLWQKFEEQYGENSQNFMGRQLCVNQPLVEIVAKTLGEESTVSSTPALCDFQNVMPKGLNFKLAMLGQAFSGKKTLAKQLIEKLGGDVKIFNMDEILKEALDYVNPKKVAEVPVVDPKAKGKAPVAAVIVPTDIFEGKDNVAYKKIVNEIKQKFFTADELPQKCDLVELVLEDRLLTSLFTERLKLHYVGQNIPERDIHSGIVREKELIQQIEDIDAALAAAAADPKSKGKPAKGGPDPEKLKAELEDIRNFKPVGWILVDFPRTLSQAKLLEKEMTGFQSGVDQEDSSDSMFKQKWHKLVTGYDDVKQRSKIQVRQSAFDAFVFIDVPADECIRRSKHRKIDPQTNNVYHMEDSPPEVDPKDAKIMDRLQDYHDERGDQQRLKRSQTNYECTVPTIKQWCQQFGLSDHDGVAVSLNQDVHLRDDLNSKVKVREAFISQIHQVIKFKQGEFTKKRMNVQLNSAVVESETNPEAPKSDRLTIIETTEQQMLKTKMSATGFGGASSQGGTTILSVLRKKQMQRVYQITEPEKVKRWKDMTEIYFKSNITSFQCLQAQRGRIFGLLNDTQQKFIDFLERPGLMQKKIHEFSENFNRFSEEYPELRQKEETRQELVNRVDILNKNLWSIIVERKNEALEEKANIMSGGWSTVEKNNLCCLISSLIDFEFQRFHGCVNVTIGWVYNEDLDLAGLCKKLVERGTQAYAEGPQGPYSPIMDNIIGQALTTMGILMQEQFMSGLDQASLDILTAERTNFNIRVNTLKIFATLLLEEIQFFSNQVFEQLENWIVVAVKKENEQCQSVVKKIRKCIELDAAFLESYELSNGLSLYEMIERIDFKEGPPRYMQEMVPESNLFEQRFSIDSLVSIYNQFRKNCFEDLLDSRTFISLMIQNYQAQVVPVNWTQASFKGVLALCEIFEQAPLQNQEQAMTRFGSKESKSRKFVNWKQIFTLMLLGSSAKPSAEALDKYIDKLSKNGEIISLNDFKKVDSWFDSHEAASTASKMLKASACPSPGQSDEEEEDVLLSERLLEVKTLLFETNQRTNERGLRMSNLKKVIVHLNTICADYNSYADIIFSN